MTEDKLHTYRGQMYGTNRRRTEKIRRLVKLWSERDLAHLPAMQRVAQEREMANAYKTFDEKGLLVDTALTVIEYKAPAQVESSGEETPSDSTKQEKIVLQMRRRLGMREAARRSSSPAVKQLLGMRATQSRAVVQLLDMKAHYNQATKKNLDTL
jgi:hypothetical protein